MINLIMPKFIKSFKYLGGIEVFESRGMQICEGALKLLRVCFKSYLSDGSCFIALYSLTYF